MRAAPPRLGATCALATMSVLAGEAEVQERACQLAEEYHAAARFEAAATVLEQAVAAPSRAPCHYHLLGKSYGRMAEQAPWYKAPGLARRTLDALNRAVELDDRYLPALRDLMEFHLQAPGIVGGDAEQAERLRRRIEDLQAEKACPSPRRTMSATVAPALGRGERASVPGHLGCPGHGKTQTTVKETLNYSAQESSKCGRRQCDFSLKSMN